MALTLNEKFLAGFVGEGEIASLAAQTRTAHETVRNASGAGSDFLGWLDLPVNYDKEEFARIQAAAERIKKMCDVLVDYYAFCEIPEEHNFWFGTDYLGRDLWTRTWRGARVSLIIAVTAMLAVIALALFAVRNAAHGRSTFYVIASIAAVCMMMDVVQNLCDRCCIIEKGKLQGVYDLKELKENNQSLEEIFMRVTGNRMEEEV